MNAAQLSAAEYLYRALGNLPCICVRKFPYSGDIVQHCQRCKARRQWEAAKSGIAVSTTEGDSIGQLE